MTLEEVTIEAEAILPTVSTAQTAYHAEHGDYEETASSHDTVPPALNRIPTNDHYSVGAIPFSFRVLHIRRQGVTGWFLDCQTIKDSITYHCCISGTGPENSSLWNAL